MRQYLIYALEEPLTGEVRYVGRSSEYLYRPKRHWYKKENNYCSCWCWSLIEQGREPKVVVIEECPEEIVDKEQINNWLNEQERFWIEFYLNRGERLTNLTSGGDGMLGYRPSKDTLEKISKSLKGKKYPNRKISEDSRKALSMANKGRTRSEEVREKLRAANLGKKRAPETIAKIKKAQKGVPKKAKKVRCVNDGMEFRSDEEAATFYKIHRKTVWNICNEFTKKSTSGLIFEYIVDNVGQNV